MTIGKRAKKFYYEKVLKSDLRIYLDARLAKVVNNIEQYMVENFKYIGMCTIEGYLLEEYVKIANSIYKRYGKKLFIDEFSDMIIKKIRESNMLELGLKKDFIFFYNLKGEGCYYEMRAKVWGINIKVRYLEPVKVYWNSGVTIDDKFIKKYIREVFDIKIQETFMEEFKSESRKFEFDISKFKFCLNRMFHIDEIDCLRYFGKISEERFFEEIKILAEQEDLIFEKNIENGQAWYYISIK